MFVISYQELCRLELAQKKAEQQAVGAADATLTQVRADRQAVEVHLATEATGLVVARQVRPGLRAPGGKGVVAPPGVDSPSRHAQALHDKLHVNMQKLAEVQRCVLSVHIAGWELSQKHGVADPQRLDVLQEWAGAGTVPVKCLWPSGYR